ncbi:hypothetical protein ABZV93_17665 [Actinopolymorpha sp. NPDC004070]|uniref:hypothetical protein n=1 Tax=Actinopolymorpha sp. NPDC004070 TaxID=3154548 RepID=UPI0033B3CAA4
MAARAGGFDPAVVGRRIQAWLAIARQLLVDAERWGERAGSFGRYWTHFEARADRHGGAAFAERLLIAASAKPHPAAGVPEWLADRIALSYQARLLVGESVTPEQNARDNLLAYPGMYRARFPTSAYAWMAPQADVDVRAAISTLQTMIG